MSRFKVKVHSADADEVRGLINIDMKESNIATILVKRGFAIKSLSIPSMHVKLSHRLVGINFFCFFVLELTNNGEFLQEQEIRRLICSSRFA